MAGNSDSTCDELTAECLRHVLAHSSDVEAGIPHRGCQFCPTLKVRLFKRPPRPGFMRPGMFPQPFFRDLARRMNRIQRMVRGGHFEATKFMVDLEVLLRSRPWNPLPPSTPAMIQAAAGVGGPMAQVA